MERDKASVPVLLVYFLSYMQCLDWLKQCRIETVTDSTGVYWIPVFRD